MSLCIQASDLEHLISSTQKVTHQFFQGEASVFSRSYIYMKGQIQECWMRPLAPGARFSARTEMDEK